MFQYLLSYVAGLATVEPVSREIRDKFHNRGIPINVPPRALKTIQSKLVRIEAKAGDFIIWRRELAHGNGMNCAKRPRLAQYINMYPER